MVKTESYKKLLDQTCNAESLEYLTVAVGRTKQVAQKCKKLIRNGNYGEALRIGDPIAFEIGLKEYKP